jgi:hypothetical protein
MQFGLTRKLHFDRPGRVQRPHCKEIFPMRRTSGKDKDLEDVPLGGRAFQRIQQDRTARGLDKLPVPGRSGPAPNKRAPNERMNKMRKKK